MNQKTPNVIDVFNEIFETYKEYTDTMVEKHILKLKELDEHLPATNSYFILSNTTKRSYEFVSDNFKVVTGLNKQLMLEKGMPYFFDKVHPDDLLMWMKLMEDFMRFTMTEVIESERNKLSYTWNYRAKNGYDEYINIVEHQTTVEFDIHGKPIIGIGHSTVVGHGEQRPIIGCIKQLNDHDEYETIYYKNYSQKLLIASISNREKDIVRLLSLNNTSKEIAKKLFISQHTVDVHRRNILKKLNFNSTKELVQYCLLNQLF